MPPATTPRPKPTVPITLSFEATDDLIYDARSGDLEALTADVASLAAQHHCAESQIVASAIDMEDESEGGTGSCVLHFPAANGNTAILTFLLEKLSTADTALRTAFVNHRNHSGNTPLHWAALNTHLDCVKALVEAGAEIATKNDAGHDAVFLAERSAWASAGEGEASEDTNAHDADNGETQESEMTVGEQEGEDRPADGAGGASAGRRVVEWLLGSEKAAGLEGGAREADASESA